VEQITKIEFLGLLWIGLTLVLEVPAIDYKGNEYRGESETSAQIKSKIIKARQIQLERYDGYGINTNSRLDGKLLINYAMPVDNSIELLNEAAIKFKLSMRAYNRTLRVARTIADLELSEHVKRTHLAEALSYRNLGYRNSG
jgi:magnesium chelatase family protein